MGFCIEASNLLELAHTQVASWWTGANVEMLSDCTFEDFSSKLRTGKDLTLFHLVWLARCKGKRAAFITSALTWGQQEGGAASVQYSSQEGIGHVAGNGTPDSENGGNVENKDGIVGVPGKPAWLGSIVVIHHRSGGNDFGGHFEAVLWADPSVGGEYMYTGVYQACHVYVKALSVSGAGAAKYEHVE
jgi:hypothetical protein